MEETKELQQVTMKEPKKVEAGYITIGEQQKILSKREVLEALIAMGLFGFLFGIGATLAIKTVNGIEELIIRMQ